MRTRFFFLCRLPTPKARDAAAPRTMRPSSKNSPRPFLKWVGGKTQLLSELEARLPLDFADGVRVYAEPFVGGGAFLWRILSRPNNLEKVIINDLNPDLANAYGVIQSRVEDLITTLHALQRDFRSLANEDSKREFYLSIRASYNQEDASHTADSVLRAAQMLFMNRTCFNGLYRVNAKGAFNVPFGRYANPQICDEETLRADAAALSGVEILNGDFANAVSGADAGWFVYFDPPYRPLSSTSSFCDYTQGGFDDGEQRRLAALCRDLDGKGARWLLSNSDPKGRNPADSFFDELYAGFEIQGVQATRMLNSNPEKRGKLGELLISNYTNGGKP